MSPVFKIPKTNVGPRRGLVVSSQHKYTIWSRVKRSCFNGTERRFFYVRRGRDAEVRGGTTRLKKKEEDTDGEFDVYRVRKRFSFRVSRVRRSVVVRSASTRVRRDLRAAATTERKRSVVAEKERTRRSSEKKEDFSFAYRGRDGGRQGLRARGPRARLVHERGHGPPLAGG